MPYRVSVNIAHPHELLALPGVGPEQAERIVKFRDEHGPIGNESELSRVLGLAWSRRVDVGSGRFLGDGGTPTDVSRRSEVRRAARRSRRARLDVGQEDRVERRLPASRNAATERGSSS